jgi:hypothetical protein
MSPRKYRNFDLVFEKGDEGFEVHVVDSPAGEAHGSFALPFGPHELENFILKMGARRGVRRAGPGPRTAAQAFGQTLYGAVFTSDVEYALRQSLQDCQSRDEGLRVRLRLHNAPELADLPWEYLHSTALGRPLALSVDTPVVRYMDMGQPVEALEVEPPLRILVVAASPSDIEALDTQRELANLREATSELVRDGRIEVHALASPTVEDLQHQLRKEAFHILHFMGHGIFDESSGMGMLAFEDDEGRARPVAGTDLGMMLHDHRGLQMVVLHACEGARTSVQDPLGGVAQSLARQGIPAVVAMQFEISDAAAKRFSRELYLAIADGYPVDAAVSEARKALYLQDRATEWGTPVLHLRAADGRIFDLKAAPKPAEVPVLMEEVEARAEQDPLGEISAIGILQRILEIDPDNAAAAAQLERLQASARRDRGGGSAPAEESEAEPVAQPEPEAAPATRAAPAPAPEPTAAPDPVPGPDPAPAAAPATAAAAAPAAEQGVDEPPAPPAAPATSSATPTEPVRAVPSSAPSPSPSQDESAPPPVPPAPDGPTSPWPKRIGIGVAAVLGILLVLGVIGSFLEDDGPVLPTAGPFPTPTDESTFEDLLAWYGDVSPLGVVAVTTSRPLVIDGDLSDWPVDGYFIDVGQVVHGDLEVAGVGMVAWDEFALYVSASVGDDFVDQAWQFEPDQLWRGDSVSFEWAVAPPDDPDAAVSDGDLHVLLGPDDGFNDGVVPAVNPARDGVFRAGGVEPAIELASFLTDTGYDIEAAIPWDLLGGVPAVGEVVGFNLNISNGTGDGDFSSMTSSTEGRTSANQPRPACWGRMLMWDDPAIPPNAEELPEPADVAPC